MKSNNKKHPVQIDPIQNIDPSLLDTFPFHMEDVTITDKNGVIQCSIQEAAPRKAKKAPDQIISISTPEFSAVCPFSGLPDIGELQIEYIPHRLCVELKSFKYYLLTYRNAGIYQEHATTRIFNDLNNTLAPVYLKVTLTYNIRGGMSTRCEMETEKQHNKGDTDGKG